MTTRILESEQEREKALQWLRNFKLPCTLSLKKGRDRTPEQNRLQRLWCNEASEQLQDDTAEGYRAYCKLHFGIPILRNESEEFCAVYDRIVRPLAYEDKLALMAVPIDFPVTRLMTTKQKHDYLEAMRRHLDGLGVKLTIPADRK